ncbi:MAG: peptidylprolyl isomerase [Planctomycetes bacterium]|nr:peptidylprolyl isomerase [Planctomycetota bacterium]MCB9868637.1 peptidylprolyl isomerase [Planctomycetota bacterium]MCB9889199.1 peptidylprolyl isomerase [Planctomycetota bacterium]
MPDVIADGMVVAIHFTLTLDDGEVVESSAGEDPALYLHGHGNIVPGLEQALVGKGVGDRLSVSVPPELGFGEHDARGQISMPRSELPDDLELEVGEELAFDDGDGGAQPGWVTEIDDETVHIDLNPPLAGETLHFEVEVVSIRSASAEELEHGHPHGPGGHAH